MTLEEHIADEKQKVDSLMKSVTELEPHEVAVRKVYEERAKEHQEKAKLLEELKRRRELSEKERPIRKLLLEERGKSAILRKALELSCIDRSNYMELVDAYLGEARIEVEE